MEDHFTSININMNTDGKQIVLNNGKLKKSDNLPNTGKNLTELR